MSQKKIIVFTVLLFLITFLTSYASGGKAVAKSSEVVDLTIMQYAVDINDTEGIKNDRVKKFLEEKFNIRINWKTGFPEDYAQKIMTGMAAATAADLFTAFLPSQITPDVYAKWVEDGALVDLGKYVFADPERYSSMKLAFDHPYYKMYNHVFNDGREKYFAWYALNTAKYGRGGEIYNGKLLKELGLDVPETFDEFIHALRMAKEKLGIMGYAWISYNGTNWKNLDYKFFNTHGTFIGGINDYETYFQDDSGAWYDISITDKNKEVWKMLQDYYQEGLLDPTWLTQEAYAWIKDYFLVGKMLCGDPWVPQFGQYNWVAKQMREMNPDFVPSEDLPMSPHPMKGPGGIPTQMGVPFSVSQLFLVPYSSEEKAERILDLMNYFASDEGNAIIHFGVKGIHYTKDDFSDFNLEEFKKDTSIYMTNEPDRTQYAFFRYFTSSAQRHAPFVAIGDWAEGISRGIDILAQRAGDTPEYKYGHPIDETYIKEGYKEVPIYRSLVKYSEEDQPLIAKLRDVRNKWFTNFLLGEKDVEKEWDNFISEYNAAGGKALLNSYAKMIDEAKVLYESIVGK